MKQRLLFYILFFIFCLKMTPLSAQNSHQLSMGTSYELLEAKIKQQNIASEITSGYIIAYIEKAKKENNLKKLYRAYDLAISNSLNDIQIKYADSLIFTAIKMKEDDKIGEAFVSSSQSYMSTGHYKNALEQSFTALKYFEINNNQYLINTANYNIAEIKKHVQDYEEAYTLLAETTDFFRNHQKQIKDTDYRLYYIYSLISLIDCNSRLENFEENKKLISEGHQFLTKQKNLSEYLPYLISSEGTDAYFQKKYPLAIIKLNQALGMYRDKWKHLTEKFYIGMSYDKMNQPEQALPYFKIIEKDYNEINKTVPEFRPAFEFFVQYYHTKDDKKQQLLYINKLLDIDASFAKNYRYISKSLHKDYDEKKLTDAKAQIENSRINERIFVLFSSVSIIIGILYFFRRRNKKLIKPNTADNFSETSKEKIIDFQEDYGIPSSINEKTKNQKTTINYDLYKPITNITVDQLIKKLEFFEQQEGFTEPNLKLYHLAKSFYTNEKYLSKIIQISRGQNFNDYITDLRLDYFMKTFDNKSAYKNITELSQKSGFDNYQFFSKEFKNRFKVAPTDFK